VTSLISVVIAVIGAGAMAIWMPGRRAVATAAGAADAAGVSDGGADLEPGVPVLTAAAAGGAAGRDGADGQIEGKEG
jgi:hypothetical protein